MSKKEVLGYEMVMATLEALGHDDFEKAYVTYKGKRLHLAGLKLVIEDDNKEEKGD